MLKVIKVSNLKPHPNNPRIIKDDKFQKLVKSLKEFPEMLEARPIVVNEQLIVLGGNMRLRALEEAGIKETKVEIVDWSPEKQAEFMIKDNVEFGAWNWDDLANNWDMENLVEWGVDKYNFGTAADLLSFGDLGDDDGDSVTIQDPKITDEGYVRFEVVMLEEQKETVIAALKSVQETKGGSLGEALFHIISNYN
jgi:hypothetical protein